NAIDAVSDRPELSTGEVLSPDNEPVSPKITIKTERQDERVIIRITDNGKGIPSELQNQIFNPFFTTKEVGQGLGLGLAISYEIIVKKHQGRIRCESHPNRGTEFTIEIPCGHHHPGEITEMSSVHKVRPLPSASQAPLTEIPVVHWFEVG
ncbi:MAG TPA: ATP-binding protein, partial [Vampirovibrionales bacterium]